MGLTNSRAQSIEECEGIIAYNEKEIQILETEYKTLLFGDPKRVINRRTVNYRRNTIATHKGILERLRRAEPYLGEPEGICSVPAPSPNKRNK